MGLVVGDDISTDEIQPWKEFAGRSGHRYGSPMEAQAYYQNVDGAAGGGVVLPPPLRWLRVALALLLVLMVALPVLMTVDRGFVVPSIQRDDPFLSGDDLDFAVTVTLAFTWAVHFVYGAVAVWFTVKALRGRHWARIALTVAMVVATLNSLDSAAAGPEYYWAVIPSDVLQVGIVVLLWLPRSSRAFFAAHRRRDRAARGGA